MKIRMIILLIVYSSFALSQDRAPSMNEEFQEVYNEEYSDESYSSSSLNSDCKGPGFNCGECETKLQDDLNGILNGLTGGKIPKGEHWSDAKSQAKPADKLSITGSVEKTLGDIIAAFKKNNPAGDNRLNFVVIGESESLQGTSIKNGKIYPRIMLKSPNSELMVTFNTDPQAPGYNTLEIMRWNGKKGRYEFQELDFGDKGKKAHLDLGGSKCLECHKTSPRPNWDTYRAWAGVVPARDDMLEMHGENGSFDKSKGMQPDAKAYINFLDQVAADKDARVPSRLSLLDIPFDDKVQLKDYVKDTRKPAGSLTSKEKVEIIKRQVEDKGFYRIKHFPDLNEAQKSRALHFNFDSKTASLAGPSQFAFDQMIGQNMCKVSVDLKNHPDFDKFKYPLALLMKCRQYGFSSIYPENYKKKVLSYYNDNNYSGLADLPKDQKPSGPLSDFNSLEALINKDTEASHGRANQYKFDRHSKFLRNYLSSVDHRPDDEVNRDAKYYSEIVETPEQYQFHAISDYGGVKGVPEGNTPDIANARLLLEPFGVNVNQWSLVHGKDNAYNSYSFSDQYSLLSEQPLFQQILKEAGGSCAKLEEKAIASLKSLAPERAPADSKNTEGLLHLDAICSGLGQENKAAPINLDTINAVWSPMVKSMKAPMQQAMKKCEGCHGDDSGMTFPGLTKFVTGGAEDTGASQEFTNFLLSTNNEYSMNYLTLFQYKLGLHGAHAYGSDMPPTKWKDNEEYGKANGLDPLNVQNIRRKELAIYLTMMTTSGSDIEQMRKVCGKVNQTDKIKEIKARPVGERTTPGSVTEQ